jgi:HSP20 family molecular chaperone IbpA
MMATSVAPTEARQSAEPARSLPVFSPATDIWEGADRLVLQASIPGTDPDSVDVSVERNLLRITARSRMAAPAGYNLIHGEYRNGNFERAFTLPAEIATDGIVATVKNGLLTLVLPKVAPPPSRKIAIKVG